MSKKTKQVDQEITELLGFSEEDDPSPEEVAQAITDLAAENVASFGEGGAKMEAMQAEIDSLRTDGVRSHFAEEVSGLTIQGKPEDLVEKLIVAHSVDPKVADSLLTSFKEADTAVRAATKAQTRVSSTPVTRAGSFDEAVRALQRKDGSSYSEAYEKAKGENADLYSEYSDDRPDFTGGAPVRISTSA